MSLIAFSNEELKRKWILNPYLVHHRNQWWRMLTSGFIHADFMHLFFNLFAFYGFGMAVENYYDVIFEEKGMLYFIVLYLGAILVANGPSLAKNKDNHWYNSLGASGGVSAIIFAAIIFQPWSKIYFFGIIGVPGIILGPLYLLLEYKLSDTTVGVKIPALIEGFKKQRELMDGNVTMGNSIIEVVTMPDGNKYGHVWVELSWKSKKGEVGKSVLFDSYGINKDGKISYEWPIYDTKDVVKLGQ